MFVKVQVNGFPVYRTFFKMKTTLVGLFHLGLVTGSLSAPQEIKSSMDSDSLTLLTFLSFLNPFLRKRSNYHVNVGP